MFNFIKNSTVDGILASFHQHLLSLEKLISDREAAAELELAKIENATIAQAEHLAEVTHAKQVYDKIKALVS